MATHHGKEGVVKAGGTGIGELTGFTLETTADVVEDTQLSENFIGISNNSASFSPAGIREYLLLTFPFGLPI